MKKLLFILSFIVFAIPAIQAQGVAQSGEEEHVQNQHQAHSHDHQLGVYGDTVYVALDDSVWLPSPKKAAMLSAAFPGAGQIYNHQWWKAPIIYATMGTIAYFIYWNNDNYVKYRNAYIDFVDDDPTTTRYDEITPDGYVISDDSWFESTVENRKDNYRRDRDLLIISLVGVYALNIIEANVAAHLYDFDVSDDLSLNVSPDFKYDWFNRNPTVGVSLRLNINK